MRYMLAMVLALGIGVAAAVPAAFAGEEGGWDYVDRSTSQAPAVLLQTEPTNLGTVSGPMAPDQIVVLDHDNRN